ncbi:radical SAM family heme chaperone HemW [bacterium]|nr:radical SAM family heme chaperone HemW [bacterium]
MVKSVYIHIPFCKSKCHYCSFVSFPALELKKDYIKALEKEINYNYENELLSTLYFGGGTPSLLTSDEFEKIINHFNINNKTEITTELNPESVNYEYIRKLYEIGINRISLGCQTFDDKILKLINRRHNSSQVIQAVKAAQDIGFKNISLDFIYGLPDQTIEMFIYDLKKAVELGIQHISLYGLSIESGCYFSSHIPKNLPDDDKQADMYLEAVEFLTSKGFEHYEISNFSQANYNSKHNLNYWNNEEYYGFGVSAHGYKNGIRYGNKETIKDYIDNPIEHNVTKCETLQDKLEEEIFLGFRKIIEGVNVDKINSKYSIDFENKYKNILLKYSQFLRKTPQGYAFTPKGALISNTILAEFLA